MNIPEKKASTKLEVHWSIHSVLPTLDLGSMTFRCGRRDGLRDGINLGIDKGFEIGSELGYYEGAVKVCCLLLLPSSSLRLTENYSKMPCSQSVHAQFLSRLQNQIGFRHGKIPLEPEESLTNFGTLY